MTRKGKSLTISLSPSNREALERLASQFGCLWGDEPNISGLITAIAEGEIELSVKASVVCPTCEGSAYKNGRNGTTQRYYCDNCQKTFQLEPTIDRRAKRKLTAAQMQEMRDSGQTLQAISEQAGICREAVRRATKSPPRIN
jgi:transposase-like protein